MAIKSRGIKIRSNKPLWLTPWLLVILYSFGLWHQPRWKAWLIWNYSSPALAWTHTSSPSSWFWCVGGDSEGKSRGALKMFLNQTEKRKMPRWPWLAYVILSQLENIRLHLATLTSCSCQLKTMQMCFEFSRQGCITSQCWLLKFLINPISKSCTRKKESERKKFGPFNNLAQKYILLHNFTLKNYSLSPSLAGKKRLTPFFFTPNPT